MCVALVDRFGKSAENDQIKADAATMSKWIQNSIDVLFEYIDRQI